MLNQRFPTRFIYKNDNHLTIVIYFIIIVGLLHICGYYTFKEFYYITVSYKSILTIFIQILQAFVTNKLSKV